MESEHEFYSLLLFFFHAVSSNTCFRRALRRWLGRKSWLTRDSRGLFKCFLDLTVNTSPQQSHKSLHLPLSSIHPTTKALWHPQSCIFFFLSPSVSFATPKLSDGKIVRGVNGIEFRVKKKSLKALFMAVFLLPFDALKVLRHMKAYWESDFVSLRLWLQLAKGKKFSSHKFI